MQATAFEFNQRFWLIGVIFWLGFALGSVDHVNAAVGLLHLFKPSLDADSAEGATCLRLILVSGAMLVFLSALLRTWATAYLRADVVHDFRMHSEKHVADGPFRYVRNPLYLGNIILAASVGVMASRLGWLVLVLGMTLFVYRLILREESGLLETQGASFREYLRKVPRLVPSLTPRLPAGNQPPRWGQAIIGEAFIWLFGGAVLTFAFTLRFKPVGIMLVVSIAVYFLIALARKMSVRRNASISIVVVAALSTIRIDAVTRVGSADGQFWDIQDTSPWSQDSGGIATGGRAYPFNGFGYLKLQVQRPDRTLLVRNHYLTGFGLASDGAGRFDSITPLFRGDIVVSRALFAPPNADYLRYFDSFTNVADQDRLVDVAWGGATGAYEDGGLVTVATSSSGDRRIDAIDTFVTVMQNAKRVDEPMKGPSGHGPSSHVLGSRSGVLASVGDMYGDPFSDPYPGFDPAHIGYVFRFTVRPRQTVSLMTFVVKGLSEVYGSRGATTIPSAGSEIARVTAIARKLVAEPDLRGLTARQRSEVLNWNVPRSFLSPFSVVEKTTDEIQDALTRGLTTSEDVVRDYLMRLSLYDRNGPTLRTMLALNPRAVAEARALDAERAAGRLRSPFHGIPIAFKDNIDVLGLPTTGGSLALVDHRPRLDSRMAAGMRRGGAVMLGKANLDEFPFGDFGISSVAGTIGNAYDPSLSTAGSSGGSAVAVSTSLVTVAFGTDTCNSLSNPAAFASLATIRTTRGLTSRAGVMPLNPYNDAVGPLAKTVREVALVLDQVAGPDPEDPVTADARSHIAGSFAAGLQAGALSGARIGLLRQRFVGVTGEREIALMMDTVAKEIEKAGATVIDVSVPGIEERYRRARGIEPGALKAAWNAYLSRGARSGERVITLEELLASGKLAPVSARRFETALAPTPTGDALREASRAFNEVRESFRDFFIDLMERDRLDALLYPANLARPHTHEGGLERYGGEPSTCEESALTGLPQVTVPGGFIGDRYPFGVSFLGRPWTDARMLALAYAYEQATHHRRPPTVTK